MRWLIAALVIAIAGSGASAEERIHDYHSQIAIAKDGTVDVTETIRVQVDNVAINHGIYRDFPTRYNGARGQRVKIGFTLIETTLDGASEPNKSESLSNGVRVKIGSADRTVPVGEHVYTIHYTASRELGRFPNYDELYWNVTGNGWIFPIDHASATITLPSAAAFGQRAIYTGHLGENTRRGQVSGESAGTLSVETNAPLEANEGLTVAAAFPKGVVDAPSQATRLGWFIADWAPPLVALLGLGGVIAFLYVAWRRAGRDPRAGTMVPIFLPPDKLTPSAMRYLTKQKFDNRGFAAALVDAAVKGHIRLVEASGGFFKKAERSIERPANTPQAQPLEVAEQVAVDMLVGPGETIAMDNANHEIFGQVIKGLSDTYDKRFEGVAFNRNLGWAFAAIGVAVLGLLVTALSIVWAEASGGSTMMMLAPLLLVAVIVVWASLPTMKTAPACAVHLVLAVLGGAAVVATLPAIPVALTSGRWLPILIAAIGLPLALSAFAWIEAPTKDGRAMLDRIAGFKQYLSITERDRLDRMQAPQDNLQLFERFLPYAIALEVENRWADRFTSMLAAASAAAAQGSSAPFLWYSGSSDPWTDTGGFVGSIGDSLSSAVSSASTAPGSSSGSGGGGSSGGGGGGGGGGGW